MSQKLHLLVVVFFKSKRTNLHSMEIFISSSKISNRISIIYSLYCTHSESNFSTTTTTAMVMTSNNDLSAYIAHTSVVNLAFFEEIKDTAVRSSKLTIPTIVPPYISAEPYLKAMIAILSFRHIISLSPSPFVSLSDLTTTVPASFALPIDSAGYATERIVD